MKKILLVFCLLVCSLCVVAAKDKKMFVSAERVEVKAKAGMFGKVTGALAYGQTVFVTESKGKWVYVTSETDSKTVGWIPATALTSKKIKMSGVSANASAKELALAGKGFTQEIEDSYKQNSGDINYDAVDVMEATSTDMKQLEEFISDGSLVAGE